MAVLVGRLGGGGLQALGQAGQLIGLQIGDPARFVGLQILAELGEEGRQPLVDRGHPDLGLGIQLGAGAHEVVPVDPGQPLLLARQLLGRGRFVDRLDAGEELRVLDDLVAEGGEFGVHLVLDLLIVGRGEVPRPDAGIDQVYPAQRLAGQFQGLDGVLEGGRRAIVGDRGDLAPVQRHGLFQRRLEIGDLDLVEPRIAAVGARPGRQHRVGEGLGGGRLGRVRLGGRGRGHQRRAQQGRGADAGKDEVAHVGVISHLECRAP